LSYQKSRKDSNIIYKIRAKFRAKSKDHFLPAIRQLGRDRSIGSGLLAFLRFIYLALVLIAEFTFNNRIH